MVMFVIGIVVGGFIASLLMALVTANKKADCMESDYYKSRFVGVAGKMKSIISRFRNNELSADDAIDQIENELKL